MKANAITAGLSGVKQTGSAEWVARCPAHEDRSPSLAIRETDDGRVLLHCFAGCDPGSVLDALGIGFDALFPEAQAHHKSKIRHPFSPAAVLKAIAREATICAIAASDASRGVLTEIDRTRMLVAVERINEAVTYA